jgi:hypothetical protein
MVYEEMFDTTSFCPYSKQCESYRTIVNSEEWMGKALSKLRRMGVSNLPRDEGGYSELMLESKLEQLRKVKYRCYRYNGRCLRFWQLKKAEEKNKSINGLKARLGHLERSREFLDVEQPVH